MKASWMWWAGCALVSMALMSTGCLVSAVNRAVPSFRPIARERVPDVVIASFVRSHPDAEILKTEQRRIFHESLQYKLVYKLEDETFETCFREDGSAIPDTEKRQELPAKSKDDS